MIEYKCPKCQKMFKQKIDLDRHMAKKFPCVGPNKTIIYKCPKCNETFNSNNKFGSHIKRCCEVLEESGTSKIDISDNQEFIFECNYCKKKFARNDSLKRHITSYCKVKQSKEKEKEDIRKEYLIELQNKGIITIPPNQIVNIDNLNNTNINNITNNVNNNNNINIQLVAYGKEDRTLTDLQILKLLKKGFHSVPELFNLLHYDPAKPENQNIYLSNIRSNYIHFFNGERWETADLNAKLEDIFNDSRDFLRDKKDEIKEKTSGKTQQMAFITKFERFDYDIDEYPKKKKEIISMLKFALYNNRESVIQIKNLFEKQQKLKSLL